MFVYTIFTYTCTLGKAISFWLLGIPQMQVIVRGSPQHVPNNSGFLNYSTYYLHRIYIYRYMYMYVKNRTIYYMYIYLYIHHVTTSCESIRRFGPLPKGFLFSRLSNAFRAHGVQQVRWKSNPQNSVSLLCGAPSQVIDLPSWEFPKGARHFA